MTARPFTHLHCHSHYSLLVGASSIDKLVQRTIDHGMTALALTDHGNLHGALEFYQAARSRDINPIIGYEAYVAEGSRLSRGNGNVRENTYHLTLLCQNKTGFDNLIQMASKASLDGFYFKPGSGYEHVGHDIGTLNVGDTITFMVQVTHASVFGELWIGDSSLNDGNNANRQRPAGSSQRRHHLFERLRFRRIQPGDSEIRWRQCRWIPPGGRKRRRLVRRRFWRSILHRNHE